MAVLDTGPVLNLLHTGRDSNTNFLNVFITVLRIRIQIRIRIHLFLGFLDPDPYPSVRIMDPDLDPSINKQK